MKGIKQIEEQLDTNNGLTFFGGKGGFDYICFDNLGHIVCSGPKEKMLEYANKTNLAVAILIPVKFTTPK
jgi:hypothetical protein